MKTKLFILGGIVSLLSISTYANAGTLSCPGDFGGCSPTIEYCFDGDTQIGFKNNDDFQGTMYFTFGDDELTVAGSSDYVYITPPDGVCSATLLTAVPLTVIYDIPTPEVIPDSLLPGGQGSLEPVVNGLGSAISEFIPYVVYVGLAVLSAIIGFVAIKWLVNRVRRNSLFVFKSRKKK